MTLPFTFKKYLKEKQRIIETTQIFHHAKNIIFKKNPLKETKILQDIITFVAKRFFFFPLFYVSV
jgi:hypothetical protein